jgi:hypothetical protein
MNWFRKLLGSENKAASSRPPARPTVEALEDRCLPNATSVLTAAGKTTFAVYNTGLLFRYDPNGTGAMIGTGVRVAHGFKDAKGGVGLDVVYQNGNAYEFDSTGAVTLQIQTLNVLDMSRAFDAKGNFKLDILYTAGGAPVVPGFNFDTTGNLFEFTNTGGSQIGSSVRWATVYVDAKGNLGNAVGFVTAQANLFAFRNDSTGNALLYNSPDGTTQDLTDYSQSLTSTGQAVIDVTFGRFAGTYSLEFTGNSVIALGVPASTDNNIAPGG